MKRERISSASRAVVAGALMGLAVAGAVASRAGESEPVTAPEPVTREALSRALGTTWGHGLKRDGYQVDVQLIAESIHQVLQGTLGPPSEAAALDLLVRAQRETAERRNRASRELAQKHDAAGAAFRAKRAVEPGVTTRPSGLQYRVLKPGQGRQPSEGDVVMVNYTVSRIDGRKVERAVGVQLPVGGRKGIRAFHEVLPRMQEGEQWEVVVPAAFAYGDRGRVGFVEPGETLVYALQLDLIMPPAPKTNSVAADAPAAAANPEAWVAPPKHGTITPGD